MASKKQQVAKWKAHAGMEMQDREHQSGSFTPGPPPFLFMVQTWYKSINNRREGRPGNGSREDQTGKMLTGVILFNAAWYCLLFSLRETWRHNFSSVWWRVWNKLQQLPWNARELHCLMALWVLHNECLRIVYFMKCPLMNDPLVNTKLIMSFYWSSCLPLYQCPGLQILKHFTFFRDNCLWMENDKALIFFGPYNTHCVIPSNTVTKVTLRGCGKRERAWNSDVILHGLLRRNKTNDRYV